MTRELKLPFRRGRRFGYGVPRIISTPAQQRDPRYVSSDIGGFRSKTLTKIRVRMEPYPYNVTGLELLTDVRQFDVGILRSEIQLMPTSVVHWN